MHNTLNSLSMPKILYNVTMLKQVAELSTGKSFGELAIITNKRRNATVKTSEDTHFAVLDKFSY